MSTKTKTYRQAVASASELSSDQKQSVEAKPSSKRQPNKTYLSAAHAEEMSSAPKAIGAGSGEEQSITISPEMELLKKLFDEQDALRKQRTAIFKESVPDGKTRTVFHTWADEVKWQIEWYAIYRNILDNIKSFDSDFDFDKAVATWYPGKKPTRPYLQRFEEEYQHMRGNYGRYKRWTKSKNFGICHCAQCTAPAQTATAVSVQQDTTPATSTGKSQPRATREPKFTEMKVADQRLQECIDQAKLSWGDAMIALDE